MTIIPISLNKDVPGDFQVPCHIWQKTLGADVDIAFEFHWCDCLCPKAVAFLCGLAAKRAELAALIPALLAKAFRGKL